MRRLLNQGNPPYRILIRFYHGPPNLSTFMTVTLQFDNTQEQGVIESLVFEQMSDDQEK